MIQSALPAIASSIKIVRFIGQVGSPQERDVCARASWREGILPSLSAVRRFSWQQHGSACLTARREGRMPSLRGPVFQSSLGGCPIVGSQAPSKRWLVRQGEKLGWHSQDRVRRHNHGPLGARAPRPRTPTGVSLHLCFANPSCPLGIGGRPSAILPIRQAESFKATQSGLDSAGRGRRGGELLPDCASRLLAERFGLIEQGLGDRPLQGR